ncbi:MAG: IS30 family transposase [Candidatus Dormibacteraeota bacterium]|nr:IS30 family transposase [Candidatus Dormibacteraeota bacterium]
MPRGPRLTDAEKAEIWDRRRGGQPLTVIAQGIRRSLEGVRHYVNASGGVRPPTPARPRAALTIEDREEISRGLARGDPYRAIARCIGRPASTVSREVARNGGRKRYRASEAEQASIRRRRRPQPTKLGLSPRLRTEVECLLKLNWSPQQISAWLKLRYPDNPEMQISHETIYLSLYVQSRGTFRKELTRHLRRRHFVRQAKKKMVSNRGRVPDRIMISDRPAEAADRAVPGHWEGDLLQGKATDAIGTLVERKTRYVMLMALPGAAINAEVVRESLAKTILKLPASLRRSLTWDQGHEMAEHLRFTIDTGVQVYFCNPHSPWQRGTNENTNGLLRQYFPKGQSLARVTQDELDLVADQLNGRPRQTLGWKTPADALAELLLADSSSAGGVAPTP